MNDFTPKIKYLDLKGLDFGGPIRFSIHFSIPFLFESPFQRLEDIQLPHEPNTFSWSRPPHIKR